jgi:hypothetical protein
VTLGGLLGGVTNGILRKTLPAELAQLNPSISKAALFDNAGALGVTVEISATVPASSLTQLLQVLAGGSQKLPQH